MNSVRFLRPAEDEMGAAARYYNRCSPNLGARFLEHVQYTVDAIVQHPKAGRVLRGETRRRLVRHFPFAVLYRIEPDELLVVAVMDLRREPEYWVSRL